MENNKTTQLAIVQKDNNNQMLKNIVLNGGMDKLIEFCRPIAESNISPYSQPEQVAAVALWAYDKGINLMDALANTFMLNGRVALNSHLVRALLQKNNITHKVLKNYEPVFGYKRLERRFTQDQIDADPKAFKIFYSAETLKAWVELNPKAVELPVFQIPEPVDYITTIEFTRYYNGNPHKIIASFSMNDALTADLVKKDNWSKYPKQCLFARTYVIGAREIASDLIFGMYTPEEMGYDNLETITIDEDVEVLEQ
jgi:hypothetical protein